jgi:hypothetical protein
MEFQVLQSRCYGDFQTLPEKRCQIRYRVLSREAGAGNKKAPLRGLVNIRPGISRFQPLGLKTQTRAAMA